MTVSGPQRTYCKVNASEVGRSISFINDIAYTKEGVPADGKMLNLSSFSLIIASNRSFNKHCCILLNSLMLKNNNLSFYTPLRTIPAFRKKSQLRSRPLQCLESCL